MMAFINVTHSSRPSALAEASSANLCASMILREQYHMLVKHAYVICEGGTCVMASVDARALLAETGLLEAWRGVDECNSDSGAALVPPSFIERRPPVTRGESLKFGSLLDSAGEEVTPRVGVMLVSRALPLFLPYYPIGMSTTSKA
jgi:hypothetical protein